MKLEYSTDRGSTWNLTSPAKFATQWEAGRYPDHVVVRVRDDNASSAAYPPESILMLYGGL